MAVFFDNHYASQAHAFYDVDVYDLDENSDRVAFDRIEGSDVMLRPHQQTLLARCVKLENEEVPLTMIEPLASGVHPSDTLRTKLAILSDRVGSGKSYVMLALISANKLHFKNDRILKSCGMNNVVFQLTRERSVLHTNILVIPHNLTTQWTKYIQMFPNLKHCLINKKTFTALQDRELDITQYDIVIVTSTYYNKFALYVADKNVTFQRVIFDEVDHINIPSCRSIDCKFTWMITASYGNVLFPRGFTRWEPSQKRYIWCAQGIANSGFIKSILSDVFINVPMNMAKILIVKNKDEFVERSLSLPPIIRHFIECKTPASIRVLNGIVDRSIIDCLNADDVQGAIAHVSSSNKSSESSIIDIMLQKFAKQHKNLNLRLEHVRNEYVYETEQEREAEVHKVQQKIEELTVKMDMIKQRVAESNTCIICYDEIQSKTVIKCCQNSFCFKCISMWLARTPKCPLCKIASDMNDLYVVTPDSDSPVPFDDRPTLWDKNTNLANVLAKRAPGSKFLIFSNYEHSFINVYPILNNIGVRFEHLKGNGNVINCIVDRYKHGDVDVLLVNSSHYGSGLNLENTTDIIMFHKFDTEIEKQVIGRADRYGRTTPLNIWYLLYENEMVRSHSDLSGASSLLRNVSNDDMA